MSTTTPRAERRIARKNSPDRLSAGTTIAWTSTGISAAVNFVVLGFWLFYGTDVLALSPVLLGTMALVSKLLEAGAVVVAGWLVDRSPETRWGKARPYELAIVGVWAATWMLFSTPDLGDTGKAIWLFVSLVLVNVVFTSLLGANDILYMARAFRGRVLFAKVSTRTGFLTVLGVVALNVVLPILVANAGTSAPAWSMTILFIAIPMIIIGLGRFVFVKEKYQTEAADAPKITFGDIFEVLKSNRYIWIVAGVTFVSTVAQGSGIGVFYFRYLVGDIALMSLVAIVPIVILPSMLAFPWLMKKMGVSRIITLGAIAGVLGGILMVVAWETSRSSWSRRSSRASASCRSPSSRRSSSSTTPPTTSGQVVAGWKRPWVPSTTSLALAGGLGAAVVGWGLGLAGYNGALGEQPQSAIVAIVILAGVLPAVLWLGVILVMRPYRRFELMLPTITQELAVILAEDDSVSAPAVESVPGAHLATEAEEQHVLGATHAATPATSHESEDR